MKNIKIVAKLVGSFLIIAIIVLAVGILGLWGTRRLSTNVAALGMEALPGVKDTLLIEISLRQIDSGENNLMQVGLDAASYQQVYSGFDQAKKDVDETIRAYGALALSSDEAGLYKQVTDEWAAFWSAHQVFVEIARKYQSTNSGASYQGMANAMKNTDDSFSALTEALDKLQALSQAGADASIKSAQATGAQVVTIVVAGMVAGVILSIALGLIIALGITGPLRKAVDFATGLASGNFDRRLDIDQRDEVGILATSLNDMRDRLKDVIETVLDTARNLSKGASSLSLSSEQMAQGVEEIAQSAQQLSQGSSEQAASAEEVSSSLEEMTASIRQNADNSLETEQIAIKSSQDATEGGKSVDETVGAMKVIASKISIVGDIARQTNMLALNAAIEAARAGDAGRGFAVVASEVRKLAERSQSSASEIAEISQGSVAIAEKAGNLIENIIPLIKKTADLVMEISASSREQNSGSEQITKAMTQLDTVIQQNASFSEELSGTTEEMSAQAEQVAATAEELSSQAMALNEAVSFFELGEEAVAKEARGRGSAAAEVSLTGRASAASAGRSAEKPRAGRETPRKAETGIVPMRAKRAGGADRIVERATRDKADDSFEEF